MDNIKAEKQWDNFTQIVEKMENTTKGAKSEILFVNAEEVYNMGMDKVAEFFEINEECRLKEGEKSLVVIQKGNSTDVTLVEKRDKIFRCVSDIVQIEFGEESQKADERLLEKMKKLIDFEMLYSLGIREEDEKNKKAFDEFYESVERVKQEFLQKDEVIVEFENLWFKCSDGLTRKEYEECNLAFYQFFSESVQKNIVTEDISVMYFVEDKNGNSTLRECLSYFSNLIRCRIFFAKIC